MVASGTDEEATADRGGTTEMCTREDHQENIKKSRLFAVTVRKP